MKNNPFAGLGQQLGLPESEGTAPSDSGQSEQKDAKPPRTQDSGPRTRDSVPRAVIRMERSGRGGKEATVIEQLGLSPADLTLWLKALKASLGCGGTVEGDTLMLQGDHRTQLPKLLTARGVRKVIVG